MIRNINYLDSKKITHLIKVAFSKIEFDRNEEYIIAPLGTSLDSSALVCYSLFKELFNQEQDALNKSIEISQLEEKLLNTNLKKLILIDDNITSGTQLKDFFSEVFGHVDKPEIIKNPLSKNAIEKLRDIEIVVCYAIKLTEECEKIIEGIINVHSIRLKIIAGSTDYNNYTEYSSPIIESEEESKQAKELVMSRSLPLYKDKNWDKLKLYDRLYGYGNLGKLTVFNHNVPKSLIPFFWKSGKVEGRNWVPLFPERQELKKIQKNKMGFDPFVLDVANSITSESSITREPEIDFYFDPIKGSQDQEGNIKIDIVSDKSLTKVFKEFETEMLDYYENLYYEYDSLPISINYKINERNKSRSLSSENYTNYTNYIDAINEGYKNYNSEVLKYLNIISTEGKFNLIIQNIGNGAANNLRFQLSYSTSDIMLIHPSDIIKPELYDIEIKRVKDFCFHAHQFNESNLYSKMKFKGLVSGRSIQTNRNLVASLKVNRLSHRDNHSETFDYVIINRNIKTFELKYKILWDESIDGIEGSVKIHINRKDFEDDELQSLYNKM
jgi:hypothetical protein